jgi:hypothetical protein
VVTFGHVKKLPWTLLIAILNHEKSLIPSH